MMPLLIIKTCIEIIKLLTEWGWLAAEVKPQPQEEPQPELVGGIHKFKQEDE